MDIKVSVIIPTFGRPINLRRAVSSVLEQTYRNIEIIIVDDNGLNTVCGKETELVVKSEFSSFPIKYLQHEVNLNGSAARNTGVKASSGEVICFLDDDDEFLPNKISEQLSFLLNNPVYSMVYCQTIYFRSAKAFYRSSYSKSGDLSTDVLCSLTEFNTSSMMLWRSCFDALGGFDVSFRRNQDYEFLIRFFSKYNARCLKRHDLLVHVDSTLNLLDFDGYRLQRREFMSKMSPFIDTNSSRVRDFYHFDLFIYALRRRLFSRAFQEFKLVKNKIAVVFLLRRKFIKILKGVVR